VIVGRLLEPALRVEELDGVRDLLVDALVVARLRQTIRQRHRREQGFVDGNLQRQGIRRWRLGHPWYGRFDENRMAAGCDHAGQRSGDQEQPREEAHDDERRKREDEPECAPQGGELRDAPVPGHQQHRHTRREQQAARDHGKQEPDEAVPRGVPQPQEAGNKRHPGLAGESGSLRHARAPIAGTDAGPEPGPCDRRVDAGPAGDACGGKTVEPTIPCA